VEDGPEDALAAASRQGCVAASRQEAEGGALLVAALLRCMRPVDDAGADARLQAR